MSDRLEMAAYTGLFLALVGAMAYLVNRESCVSKACASSGGVIMGQTCYEAASLRVLPVKL